MDGILNVNKPPGMTSFAVVARVRRWSGERRVGHAGTLDPLATGVLPVCLGQGTRVVEYLAGATKAYRAEVQLGIATDTYDADGRVTRTADASGVTREQVGAALGAFHGDIMQTPPMYSALKRDGTPLYKLARAGIEVERPPRPARIHRLEMVDWQPPVATLEVVCEKGTYIRCLADDLGRALGCGGHLHSLVRLRVGPFEIGEAITLSALEDAFRYGYAWRFLAPVDSVLLDWPAAIVGVDAGETVAHGRPLLFESLPGRFAEGSTCRAYTHEGCFLAVLRFDVGGGYWHPQKVFGTG